MAHGCLRSLGGVYYAAHPFRESMTSDTRGQLGSRDMKVRRIAVGLEEIAGYGHNLTMGLREGGVVCDHLCIYPHKFQYSHEDANDLTRLMSRMVVTEWGSRKIFGRIGHAFLRIPLFLYSALKYDCFIFLFNNSFLWMFDLPLLRLLGKKVVIVFLGSDVRPNYMNGLFIGEGNGQSLAKLRKGCRKRKRAIRISELFANHIVSGRTISQFQRRLYVDWFWLGIPLDIYRDVVVRDGRASGDGPLRILHSPSNRDVKGSDLIEGMVERLRAKGYPIEFTEITNCPHDEVIAELKRTDLVIDQLYSDTPMATFSAEALIYGVAVVVGGYFAEQLSDRELSEMPTLFCDPDRVEEVVESLLREPERLASIGETARDRVSMICDRRKVAERYLALLSGSDEEVCYRDPRNDQYMKGSGAPIDAVLSTYRRIFHRWGRKGFMLGDREDLLKRIMEMIEADP